MSSPDLRRLRSIRLSDQAVEQIRDLIIDGHIQPGAKLPSEAELLSFRLKIQQLSRIVFQLPIPTDWTL